MINKLTKEHRAYIVGVLQADGSHYESTRNRGKITLEIGQKDKDLIHKIASIINPLCHTSIYERTRDTNFKKNYTSITLSIFNWDFRKSIKEYVPVGKKTTTISPPDFIDQSNAVHYIRGLSDADGSLGFIKDGRPFWALCTSSKFVKDFVLTHIEKSLGVKKKINRNKRDGVYNIMILAEHAQQYSTLLYTDSTLHLNRKHEKHIEIQKWIRLPDKGIRFWTQEKDKVVTSNLSIEDKMKVLNCDKKAVHNRKWLLKKLGFSPAPN